MEAEALARIQEEEAKKAAAEAAAKKANVEPITPMEAPKTGARPEEFPAEAINPAAAALAALKNSEAQAAASGETVSSPEGETPYVAPVAPSVDEKKEVTTTTTLSDLEAQLEASKEKKTRPAKKGRPRKITEEEVKRETTVKPTSSENAMPVYTEEELARIEEEEADVYDGDIESDEDIDQDYADYDQYYDDEK